MPACHAPTTGLSLGTRPGRAVRPSLCPHPASSAHHSVDLTVADIFGQAQTVYAALGVDPIPAPSASITGSPFSTDAGAATALDASASVCTTGNSCTYLWTVACPGKGDVTKTGQSHSITSGVGVGVDIDLWGAAPTLACTVTLLVDGDFGLTHTAQTTLLVGRGVWGCLDTVCAGCGSHATAGDLSLGSNPWTLCVSNNTRDAGSQHCSPAHVEPLTPPPFPTRRSRSRRRPRQKLPMGPPSMSPPAQASRWPPPAAHAPRAARRMAGVSPVTAARP